MVAIVGVGGGVLLGYIVLASLLLAIGLGLPLTAGRLDWSGEKRRAPADPLVIGYRGDPMMAFGYPFETVRYRTELGDAEAWMIPADPAAPAWAIFVHGIGGLRENGYRLVKPLHEAGLPVMMITYRNDKQAPKSEDRLYSFGLDEWRDLEAAVDWIVAQGAPRVLIVAESMGAAIAGQYLMRGANTDRVAGLALDAPALDFPAVIKASGKRLFVPLTDVVAPAGLWASKLIRRDLREAVSLPAVAKFPGPIFIAHGRQDPLVPFSISEAVVAERPDAIFVATDARKHLMSFETDPVRYRTGLARLVEALRAAA